MKKQINKKKKIGATFTPQSLANFLSDRLISYTKNICESTCVLDPACGDGALLSSFLKKSGVASSNLIGYDTDENYLSLAKELIFSISNTNDSTFLNDDFLTICPNNDDLFNEKIRRGFADIIIANPPYVRTQVLGAEKAQQLARDFNLSGRVDLYYPFFMAMTNALKVGGILGVITSNRYICTKSGADIRKYLLDNYNVLEVIDLGDTKLFDAAVLPAIFIGTKKNPKESTNSVSKYSSIYVCQEARNANIKDENNIFDILKSNTPGIYKVNGICYEYKTGILKNTSNKSDIWQLEDTNGSKWINTVESNAKFRIKDLFKVRVGIKSCADNVFISQMWNKMGIQIEDILLRPMLSQENIDTWNIDRNAIIKVLYPHYSQGGKRKVYDIEEFPNAKRYLEANKEQLEARTYLVKANRNWYEYWVPQNPALWELPKIVFPDISAKPRFCFDNTGAVVNGNCYWICATTKEEENLLLLIEGVCNSSIMTKYHDSKFTNKLYSGRRRYLSQYIEEYPIPGPNCDASKQIILLVERLNNTSDNKEKEVLASEVDKLVEKAFGLTD